METVPDNWLASILGRKAFRLVVPHDCTSERIREGLREIEPGFYYAKVSTRDVAHIEALAQCGFCVVDVSVTFERKPDEMPAANPSNCSVCDYEPDRHGDVARIGEDSFVYSRFHLDPQIPNVTANRIKRAWVENAMLGRRGDRLLVAEWEGQPAGFLIELHAIHDGQHARVIDLVAVAPAFQGRGIGSALVRHVVKDAAKSASIVRVGTQAANIPSMRLYERLGFQICETNFVLHAHLQSTAT
jgi:GNAT superfamily N-acetyltransferase